MRQYQPVVIRTPSLLILLVATLVLILLTEISVRRLPAHDVGGIASSIRDTSASQIDDIMQKRQASRTVNGTIGGGTSAPAPSNYLQVSATSRTTSSPAFQNSAIASAPPPGNYLGVSASSSQIAFKTTTTSFFTGAPAPSNYLGVSSVVSTSSKPTAPQAPLPSNYLGVSSVVSTPTTPPAYTISLSSTTSPAPNSSPLTAAAFTMTGVVAGVTYKVGPYGRFSIEGQEFNTSHPTSATLQGGDILIIGPAGTVSLEELTVERSIKIGGKDYFVGAFLPTMLAVLFTIPWHMVASAVKEMEPFYQLSGAQGALAENSLTLDYRASLNAIAILKALRNGHFLVWWVGLTSMAALVVAPLASETVFIGFVGAGSCKVGSGRVDCFPQLSVYPPVARALEGILAFIAVMTGGLLVALWRAKSGVPADPLSVAGHAALFQHQPLIEEFRRINGHSPSSKHLQASLSGFRCRLGEYRDTDGSLRYGLNLVNRSTNPYVPVAEGTESKHEQKPSLSSYAVHPVANVLFGLFVCGFITLIVYYKLVGSDTGFERFMDSASFGSSFLFTAIGIILKSYWVLIDDETRANEPFRQLIAGSAAPRDSIQFAPHSNPFTGIFHSLRHGHLHNAYISLVAILCELLIICLANIPFKPGTVFLAFTISTWLSVAILALMLIGIVWRLLRGRVADTVRRPDTMAGMLVRLCGSHMRPAFAGMAHLSNNDRASAVKSWGKRYAMGTLIGVDGAERLAVDEDVYFSKS